MTLNTKTLRSRVARRVFALFIACALAPIVVLTVLSFIQVSNQLQIQNQRELQQTAKSMGLAMYERLTIVDSELQLASFRYRQGDPLPAIDGESHFLTLRVSAYPDRIALASPALAETEMNHLLAGRSVIHVDNCSTDATTQCVELIRMVEVDHPAKGLIVGEISPIYLWSADRLPANLQLYVAGLNGRTLYTSDPDGTSAPQMSSSRGASGFFDWSQKGRRYDAVYRDIFLRAEFLADNWTVILSQDRRDVFAPLDHFRDNFWLVALLAIWIVLLLSLVQIRRIMGPLERLGEATRRISDQDFDTRVEIASGDEFQDLATSFNSMSNRLARQFHTLRAINDIDQAILSSLNRDSVIATALLRMPNLFSCDCFAIAAFQPEVSDSASVQVTVRTRQSVSIRTYANRIALSSHLRQFQQGKNTQLWFKATDTPEYLLPLKDLGLESVVVFPILLEQRPFAALLCGLSANSSMTSDDIQLATQVTDQLAVAFANVRLIEALEQLHWGTLTALARAIDAKSEWTAGHSERVTQLALKIGTAMGLSPSELQIMHRGGLLHDIGKIGTPPQILDKPGKLEPEEMQTMRDHVRIGVRILEPLGAFADALPIVAQHHEWFNGKGYPEGLAGEEISLHARIFAVADCYDALVSDRPYRKGLPKAKVVEILKQGSGAQFDPNVIDVFVRLAAEDETIHFANDDITLVGQLT